MIQRRFIIIGNPGSVRVEGFQKALARFHQVPATLVTYADLLAGCVHLSQVVRAGDIVRLESPGRDWSVECALLLAGVDAMDEAGDEKFERVSRRDIETLHFEQGRLLSSRQWFLGWRKTLNLIQQQLLECPPKRVMNAPHEIAEMFDKPRCYRRLLEAGIPVPSTLGVVDSYADLMERMRTTGCKRVFVKLAHGSSASGIVAFRTDGRQRYEAHTTIEMVRKGGQATLYNSRRIRKLRIESEIAEIIDALSRHRVHVEEWLPKAGFNNRVFDLRVLVIAGQTAHTVVRRSRSPMTNLHLLNERADTDTLQIRVPEAIWAASIATCRQAVNLYPASFSCGVDLMFTPGFRRHAILELNAFGDLLPSVQYDGESTYEAQVRSFSEAFA